MPSDADLRKLIEKFRTEERECRALNARPRMNFLRSARRFLWTGPDPSARYWESTARCRDGRRPQMFHHSKIADWNHQVLSDAERGAVEPTKPASGEVVRAYINDTYTGMDRQEINETAEQGGRLMARQDLGQIADWRAELDAWVAARNRR